MKKVNVNATADATAKRITSTKTTKTEVAPVTGNVTTTEKANANHYIINSEAVTQEVYNIYEKLCKQADEYCKHKKYGDALYKNIKMFRSSIGHNIMNYFSQIARDLNIPQLNKYMDTMWAHTYYNAISLENIKDCKTELEFHLYIYSIMKEEFKKLIQEALTEEEFKIIGARVGNFSMNDTRYPENEFISKGVNALFELNIINQKQHHYQKIVLELMRRIKREQQMD